MITSGNLTATGDFVTESVNVSTGDPVAGAPTYEVVTGGTYGLLDLVPCRRRIDTNGPICAFLCATVVGLDPSEVSQ